MQLKPFLDDKQHPRVASQIMKLLTTFIIHKMSQSSGCTIVGSKLI